MARLGRAYSGSATIVRPRVLLGGPQSANALGAVVSLVAVAVTATAGPVSATATAAPIAVNAEPVTASYAAPAVRSRVVVSGSDAAVRRAEDVRARRIRLEGVQALSGQFSAVPGTTGQAHPAIITVVGTPAGALLGAVSRAPNTAVVALTASLAAGTAGAVAATPTPAAIGVVAPQASAVGSGGPQSGAIEPAVVGVVALPAVGVPGAVAVPAASAAVQVVAVAPTGTSAITTLRALEVTDHSGPRYEVTDMSASEIFLGNDHEIVHRLRRRNPATGAREPATGLTGMTAHFSATDGGPPLSGGVTIALGERSGAPGEYFGTIDTPNLDAALAPYVNRAVYRVVVLGGDVATSRRVVVRAVRRPG